MATPKAQTQLAKLREEFPVEAVKQRPGGGQMLDYVAIETVLERLLDVAPEYSWQGHLVDFDGGTAVVEGHLTIGDKTAYGIGAMKNANDPDMAVKSANSEAMKNAAKNGFGVGLELWDKAHRQKLDRQRKSTTPAALKKMVVKLGREKTGVANASVRAMAEHFGVEPDELFEPDTMRQILEAEGVL